MAYTGGYLLNHVPLIHTAYGNHTTALDNPLSPATLNALNVVQHTPWAVNTWMADVLADVWSAGSTLAGIPSAYSPPLPALLPDADWLALTKEERHAHKLMRYDARMDDVRAESKRQYILDCLGTCRELRDRPIWFTHFFDFRTRMYPCAYRGPHPQANDLGKSLIHFAQGKPLGPKGLYWLFVRAANMAGQDKLDLDARVRWTEDHLEDIYAYATDPLARTGWAEVDEPWQFLATCYEIYQAAAASDPADFRSHLPIPLDGSCNGLQHLSAMARDPVGAAAVNLTPGAVRRDIYADVAGAIGGLLARDALAGNARAVHWIGRVDRNTVKRAVMTTPYGVTPLGIRDQLIKDGHVDRTEELTKSDLANYLRDRIVEALDGTIGSAKKIMAWLQDTAAVFARTNEPIQWTTPAGSRIQQGYWNKTTRRVETLAGEVYIPDQRKVLGIDPRRAALAAAPNLVHSFDAAHLQLTVNALQRHGVSSFAMVHDSYGTHAADTDTMGSELRRQFVHVYKRDWLSTLQDDFNNQAPTLDLPQPPVLGNYDVSKVADSQFFFA